MREIEAAVVRGSEEHTIEQVQLDDPEPGEVLVDIRATGVCHTDFHAYTSDDTDFPIVLGHEGAGIVEAVGEDVSTVEPGDSVVLWVLPSCGECQYCRSGRPYLCQRRRDVRGRMMDGTHRLHRGDESINHFYAQSSFATMSVVPERQVVPIESDVPHEIAALLGCGVTTGIGSVLNIAEVESGSTVAVFGCGGVGAGTILAASAVSAGTIVAVDLDTETLDTMEDIGATHTVDASSNDPVERVRELTGGVDYAFECIGNPATIRQAVDTLGPGGTTVITGTSASKPLELDLGAFTKGISVIGNIVGFTQPQIDIPRYISMYKNGDLPLEEILSSSFRLDELDDAFAALGEGGDIKNVIEFEPGP